MITHLGIVIPAHNEQDEILGCLDSVAQACAQVPDGFAQFSTRILVVADACTDDTVSRVADFAEHHPQVTILETSFKNVGSARNFAWNHFKQMAEADRDVDFDLTWIAFTDADSRVPTHWLTTHLAMAEAGSDCLVGTVSPRPDTGSAALIAKWHSHHTLLEDHPHVFGANLGIRGSYLNIIGGMPQLPLGEDAATVAAVLAAGGNVRRTDTCRVLTSARLEGRVEGGFSSFMQSLR